MTEEISVIRKALAAAVLAAALFAAVVVQLTVVNRLPLPGGATPDLVLLLVTAVAVVTGPVTGAVVGFAGGLALDVAPPTAHYAGEYALVFCLVGYAAASVVQAIWNRAGQRDPVTVFTVMAVAAAAGEAGKAALGMLLSDPDVTVAAISRVLPASILYDLLLSPLVFWLVTRVARVAVTWRTAAWPTASRNPASQSTGAERAPVFREALLFRKGLSFQGALPELGRGTQTAPVFRRASAGATPHLRLAGTGENYRSPSQPRRIPKLRLSGARSGSSRRTTAAFPGSAPFPLAGGRTPRLNFAGDLPARTAGPAVRTRTPGKNWLRSAASPTIPAARRAVHSPSRGWLRTTGAASLAGGANIGRTGIGRTGIGRTGARPRNFANGTGGTTHAARSPFAARQARSAGEALAARSAPSGLSALSGPGTPLAHRRSPSRGWLRGAASPGLTFSAQSFPRQRRSPRSGWLGSASRPRTVIGSRVGASARRFRGGTFRRKRRVLGNTGLGNTRRDNWYTASPSGAWLRRRRRPWRRRNYLPGRRPPVRARKARLFGLLGGHG